MIILKPDWIAHFGDKHQKVSIFSIDVHPTGTHLATGGADGHVKIWNMKPLMAAEKDDDRATKLFGTLEGHRGRVLCVRWSREKKPLLASGSDDHKVIIWDFESESNTDTPLKWSIKKELCGHSSDVVDVAWSYDHKFLATSSLDKSVIIWDAKTFTKIQSLNNHQGPVKGITWDPAGKYIATQSDDKSVKVWRTSDWSIQKDITKPFANSTSTTIFRRLSWSPEGSHIAAANAMNGATPVAAIISRDNWDSDISLVGHGASVEVVKFNPILFNCPTNPESPNPEKAALASICAIGSQDHSISVWVTRNPRPLAVAQSVFQHSVLDLSWSPDGLAVLGCSYDGSVVILQFSQQELGVPVSLEEKENFLTKYGYKKPKVIVLDDSDYPEPEKNGLAKLDQTPMNRAMPLTLENPDIISSTPQSVPGEFRYSATLNTPSISNLLDTPSSNSTLKSIDTPSHNPSQKVTLTKDGRKRIQPLFLGGVAGSEQTSTTLSQTTKPVEAQNSTQSSTGSTNDKTAPVQLSSSLANHIGGSGAEETSIDPPSKATLKDGLPSMNIGIKRKEPPNGNELRGKKTNGQTVESRPIKLSPYFGVSQIRLGVPRVKAHIVRHKLGKANFSLECHNDLSNREPAKISCTTQATTNWTDYLPSPVVSLTGNANFCAVACEDGCLYVYTYNGKRLLPCMMLDAPVSFIDSCGDFLMCITAVGLLSVWNVTQQTVLISSVSLSPILLTATLPSNSPHKSVNITSAIVRSQGLPLITTSDGQGYTYHLNMKSWVRIVDRWFVASEFYGSTSLVSDEKKNILSSLQRAATRNCEVEFMQGPFPQALLSTDRKAQSVITMSHLESSLESSKLLQSPAEYRHWLLCYARRLADEGAELRAEDLCRELLGPLYRLSSSKSLTTSKWNPLILGFPKHELLREILPILGGNRCLQRISTEYSKSLKELAPENPMDQP